MIEDATPRRRAGQGEAARAKSVEAGQVRPGARSVAHSGSPSTSRSAIRRSWTACWATRPTTPAPASPRSTSGESKQLQVRQPAGQHRRRQDPARLARRGRLRRRRRADQAAGTSSRTASWSTTRPSATRPTSSARPSRTAAATPTAGARRAVPAHAQRVARAGHRPADAGPDDRGRREGHLHRGRRLVLDRPAALQLPVRRPAVLRDQERQDRRHAARTWPTSPTPRNSGTPCAAICDERDYRLGGSFFDGKGQPRPGQRRLARRRHARFNGVNVINTARKIG